MTYYIIYYKRMAGARGVRQHGRTSSVHLPGGGLRAFGFRAFPLRILGFRGLGFRMSICLRPNGQGSSSSPHPPRPQTALAELPFEIVSTKMTAGGSTPQHYTDARFSDVVPDHCLCCFIGSLSDTHLSSTASNHWR